MNEFCKMGLVNVMTSSLVMPQFSSVQFSHSVVSDSLQPHELQHARPPCPSPTPGVHSDSRPWSQWCHPAITSSVIPFSSCPQSLPASESFPMSQLVAWGGQSTGVSALASFLPKSVPLNAMPLSHPELRWEGHGKCSEFWGPSVQIGVLNLWSPGQCKVKVKVKSLSFVWLFSTPWHVACQTPPSMGFSRQEYWSGLSFPSPGDLPDPGIKPASPTLQADSLLSELPGNQGNAKENPIIILL